MTLLLVLACTGVGPGDPDDDTGVTCVEGIDVGQCAPDFALPDQDGATYTFSERRKKVALVDIAAIW